MTIEVKVPVLPESVEDAIIAGWHKQPGDTVHRDDKLVDLETDKVVLEVPAPVDGILTEIKSAEGDTVHSDDLTRRHRGRDRYSCGRILPQRLVRSAEPESTTPASVAALKPSTTDSSILSPAARRVAEEEKVDPGSVPGTGRGGRVTKGDVINFIKGWRFAAGRTGENDPAAESYCRAYEGRSEHGSHTDLVQ